MLDTPLDRDEADQQHGAERERDDRDGIRPRACLGVREPVHEREQATRGERDAGQVNRRARPSGARCATGRSATTAVGTAIARLTYRHQRHDSACVSTPPSSSPTDAPPAAIALKIPNALGRSGDPAKVTVSSPSADGARIAPNAPWSARAATSIPNDCASPPIAEATAKPISPPISVHLRPNRSPSLPPSNSRLPNASA